MRFVADVHFALNPNGGESHCYLKRRKKKTISGEHAVVWMRLSVFTEFVFYCSRPSAALCAHQPWTASVFLLKKKDVLDGDLNRSLSCAFQNKSMSSLSVPLRHPSQQMEFACFLFLWGLYPAEIETSISISKITNNTRAQLKSSQQLQNRACRSLFTFL